MLEARCACSNSHRGTAGRRSHARAAAPLCDPQRGVRHRDVWGRLAYKRRGRGGHRGVLCANMPAPQAPCSFSMPVTHAACARAVAGIAGMPLRRCWVSWHAPAPLPPGRRNHPHQQHDNYRRGLPMRFGVDARRSSAAHNCIVCDRTPGVAAIFFVGAFLCFAKTTTS